MVAVIDPKEKGTKINDYWTPKIIAQINNCHLKMAKIEGDFVWHSHPETDEFFLVVDGELRIDFRDHSITLHSGQLCVVPQGIEHKPFAERECTIMMIERAGTLNTGDASSDRTIENPEWI